MEFEDMLAETLAATKRTGSGSLTVPAAIRRIMEEVKERDELNDLRAQRWANLRMLSEALRELVPSLKEKLPEAAMEGETGPKQLERLATLVAVIGGFVKERTEAVAALRDLCGEHGDNDWPDELNLSDVLRKHVRW